MDQKLETVDGYTIVDIEGAARLVGPIRSAKKVLQRTTIDLVRHATYACAVHGLDAAGAAAALNHDRAGEDQSPIATFADELATWAQANSFAGAVSLGLGADEAGPALHAAAADAAALTATSAVACLAPKGGPGARYEIVVASAGDEPELLAELGRHDLEARVEADLGAALTSGADAVFVRGKTGVLDHASLDGANVKAIIGLQPLTTTARGLAVASRAGAVIVPDFISAAGPTLAALDLDADAIAEHTRDAMADLPSNDVNLFVAACERAEAHLSTLTDTLPFGRPLAP